jgi:glycosyltransferase involved in cell wall biosynthesis
MSSTYEPFGQTILEAMATGTPVISWKSGGKIQTATSEFMKDRKHGYLVDFEINKMADAMEKIISLKEDEIKKISLNNNYLVSKRFTWEELAKKLLIC